MHAPPALHLEQTHGTDRLLALAAFILGAIGLLLVAVGEPIPGMLCGAVGVVAGLWGQMISRTRSERFLDVIGLVAAAVAFALGAAFGSLTFPS
jgi:membrane associated rhomboid family serine protease